MQLLASQKFIHMVIFWVHDHKWSSTQVEGGLMKTWNDERIDA